MNIIHWLDRIRSTNLLNNACIFLVHDNYDKINRNIILREKFRKISGSRTGNKNTIQQMGP